MNNAQWLKLVNPFLPVLVLWQVVTGVFADILGYERFHAVHPLGGIFLAVVAAIHLFLNRAWVKATYFRKGR